MEVLYNDGWSHHGTTKFAILHPSRATQWTDRDDILHVSVHHVNTLVFHIRPRSGNRIGTEVPQTCKFCEIAVSAFFCPESATVYIDRPTSIKLKIGRQKVSLGLRNGFTPGEVRCGMAYTWPCCWCCSGSAKLTYSTY